MELNLIISGVPNGEDYWGPSEDASYFHTIYTPSQENCKFDIRLRRSSKGCYVYYHYLVYNIVNSSSGRTGSYIGITLRLDSFCKDFMTIYQLLDMAFRKNIVGVFLQEVNGGRLQYVFESFKEKESELQKLEENITKTLGLLLKSSDISSISSALQSDGFEKLNLNEASLNDVMQLLFQRKVGCSLSLEYKSKREKKLLQEEYQKGVHSVQPEIERLSNLLNTSRGQVDSLNSQISNLNTQNTQLRNTAQQLQIQKSNLERSVRSNTVGYIPCSDCRYRTKPEFTKYLLIVFCIFCLSGLAYILYSSYLVKQQTQPLKGSIEIVSQKVETIKASVDSLIKK